jgi:transposase
MLTMEQVYRIRNMRKFEGKSLRKISQLTGHDFETVKKYIEQDDFNHNIRPKQRRKSKLSPYRSVVTTWLISDKQAPHKQQHTAKRVYDRLKELYGDKFSASERAVRKFVADIRKELQTNTDGFLPLEHPPGEAQADFGEARFIENGITYDGYYLNLSYPYSNGGHMQLFKSANQECLLEGMKAIFEHIGGVPTAIWFDEDWNVKSDSYTFGHDIEGSWLILEAAEVLGYENIIDKVRDIAVKMAGAVYTEGIESDGSIFYEGSKKGIINNEKHWWPQAEAVVGFLNAYQISGDEKFLAASLNCWDYIENYIIDKKYGEWFWGIGINNSKLDMEKGGPWKTPYHNGRACMEFLERCKKLEKIK